MKVGFDRIKVWRIVNGWRDWKSSRIKTGGVLLEWVSIFGVSVYLAGLLLLVYYCHVYWFCYLSEPFLSLCRWPLARDLLVFAVLQLDGACVLSS